MAHAPSPRCTILNATQVCSQPAAHLVRSIFTNSQKMGRYRLHCKRLSNTTHWPCDQFAIHTNTVTTQRSRVNQASHALMLRNAACSPSRPLRSDCVTISASELVVSTNSIAAASTCAYLARVAVVNRLPQAPCLTALGNGRSVAPVSPILPLPTNFLHSPESKAYVSRPRRQSVSTESRWR